MAAGVTAGTLEEDLAADVKKKAKTGRRKQRKRKMKIGKRLRGRNGMEVWREGEKWIMMIGLQRCTIEPLAGEKQS